MTAHGTAAGYSLHRRRGQVACKPCAAAETRRKTKWRDARHEAIRRLIAAHPEEFSALLADEKQQRGF